MSRLRLSPATLVVAGATLLAVVVFAAATTSSGDYLFIPDTAEPVAGKVTVQGGHEPANGGGIYFVDVSLRRARWLEPASAWAVPGELASAEPTPSLRVAEA